MQSHVNTETRTKAQPVPKLKPATLQAKIEALYADRSELQHERQQLIEDADDSPLVGQYIATKKSGGTAFSGKSEKQAAHDYYALVDATGAFICYVSKQDIAAYRDHIQLGKKVAKLNRAISRCSKRIDEYKRKLTLAEQTKEVTATVPNPLPESSEGVSNASEIETLESMYTVESDSWIVSEAA